jgi:redox-sensitive bicupin YhaK (pirin superfamily)
MTISVQQPSERFSTNIGWLDSKHSFNFGEHWSPAHSGHGLLLVNNDDRVAPASGFGTHAHRDMEIVTWVLSGTLEHRDSEGNHGVLYPGLAQRMSAGTGIRHSETNPSPDTPVHFVQMWVLPDTPGVKPGYEQLDVNDALAGGGLVPIASGKGHQHSITIHQRGAVLWGARLKPGETVTLPDDPHVHVFVALGSATLHNGAGTGERSDGRSTGEQLVEGAAARLTDAGALDLTAGDGGAEILVWATD